MDNKWYRLPVGVMYTVSDCGSCADSLLLSFSTAARVAAFFAVRRVALTVVRVVWVMLVAAVVVVVMVVVVAVEGEVVVVSLG